MTEHTQPPAVLLFSKRLWDSLAPADQILIREAARDSAAYLRTLWTERERSIRHAAKAANVTVVKDVDREAFRSALTPLYSTLVRDRTAIDLVKRIQALQ